ncbi:hypothetical protein RFI_00798 [Reticulomyxa filosa]|uniref:Uncharacterized protein n=1 Tax=Reticulomyxa filosa TaxID=46433 RepID=X6PCK4_RETFI|nr:hypothetical protein RFI_00798 [Reticulomyxa filosa]|eukprot:ETO36265.1 hypothetical protein RFI_00798 [Reticulomyxa filosa]
MKEKNIFLLVDEANTNMFEENKNNQTPTFLPESDKQETALQLVSFLAIPTYAIENWTEFEVKMSLLRRGDHKEAEFEHLTLEMTVPANTLKGFDGPSATLSGQVGVQLDFGDGWEPILISNCNTISDQLHWIQQSGLVIAFFVCLFVVCFVNQIKTPLLFIGWRT